MSAGLVAPFAKTLNALALIWAAISDETAKGLDEAVDAFRKGFLA
jgi:BioD-like phosphotransacetylase family protein